MGNDCSSGNGKHYVFPCGCHFPLLEREDETPEGVLPLIDIDIEEVPVDCPATWGLLGTGRTKGVFQLESGLGKTWTKKLLPENLEHVAALTALLRPGSLKAFDKDGISMTQHYALRKNGKEELREYHPVIDAILFPTYGVLAYQEQSMFIAVATAGFNEMESDMLRKCVSGESMFVSRQRGWISIDSLLESGYENDDFLIMDEQGKQQWKKIEKIWETGRQTVTEVESSTGFSVWATKHHQFLTDTGWKARMRLEEDIDNLVVARSVEWEGEDKYSRDWAMIVAGMITEGCVVDDKDRTATFVNHDIPTMNVFRDSCLKTFGVYPTLSKNGRVTALSVEQKKQLGQKMKFGLSGVKEVPKWMMGMTKETTRDFVSFMLAAEGGVSEAGQFEYSSKSKKMIQQMKLLLLRFGIRSMTMEKWVPDYGMYHRLFINGKVDQEKMERELTEYWPLYKKEALARIIDKKGDETFSSDTVPPTITKKMLDQYPYCARYESGSAFKQPLGRKRFLRMAEKTGDSSWTELAKGKQQYDNLVSLKNKRKEVRVYDFTVAGGDTPYIICNGMVIHNSIGKKVASEMKKCEGMFIEGAKKTGILTEAQAEEVFGWIKESQRYSFNKSHAVCYGKIGYRDAYIKAHHPLAFFAGKLKNAKECADPKEEVSELVNDARLFGVTIEVPDLRLKNQLFQTDRKRIVFGLSNIRDIGEASFTKLIHAVEKIEQESGRKIGDLTWMDFLVKYSHYFSPTAITRMIEAGALRWMGSNRKLMLNEYKAWDTLTEAKEGENDKEKEFARAVYEREKYATLPLLLNAIAAPKKEGGGCHTVKRASIVHSVAQCLENPMTSVNDSPMAIAVKEEELLGVSITHSRIDGCDASAATCTCKEYMDGYSGNIILAVSVASLMEKVTKGGKTPGAKMASGVMTDGTASVDFVVFPKEWEELGHFFSVGSTVIVSGQKGKDSDNFMVKKAFAALRSM